jgi:subtilisin family serine protease/subtilisin-like proprotein convertase family protein
LLDSTALLPEPLQVDTQSWRADRILVHVRPGQTLPSLKGWATPIEYLGGGWQAVSLPTNVAVADALHLYQNTPAVLAVQPDYRISVSRLPNDPGMSQLWGLNNTGKNGAKPDADMDAPEGWDLATGNGSIIVAVLDTGVDYNHPDLAANMWRNPGEIPGNHLDDDGNGFVDDVYGYDFANNDANPMDDNGHGTHVAGTLGAVGNNGIGIAGVAWNVRIMAVKFLAADGTGYTSNAIRALNYAVANGAKISNNSWGGGGFDQALNNAIASARAQGHIFVAAAGNAGLNSDVAPNYPASYPLDNVVSVAALNNQDQLASFSNYGARTVDLAAPGVNIYSTLPGGRYGTLSGTSMATPHVTGTLALVWEQHPDWTYRQVIDQVLNTAVPLASLRGKTVTGGRLNLAAALSTGDGGHQGRGAAIVEMTANRQGNAVQSVRVTFDQAINPDTFTADDIRVKKGTVSYAVQSITPVVGSSNTQFDIAFGTLTSPGTYSVTIGPDVRDAFGLEMDQDRDEQSGEVGEDQFMGTFGVRSVLVFAAADLPKDIPDLQTVVSTRTIGRTDLRINDLEVQVTLSHSWVGDLRLRLRAPNGQEVVLANRRGGSGRNLTDTLFDDAATQSIADGAAPYSGSFRPESSLALFTGKNAAGTWRLFVDDQSPGDTGTLLAWSLLIEPRSGSSRLLSQEQTRATVALRKQTEAAWLLQQYAPLLAGTPVRSVHSPQTTKSDGPARSMAAAAQQPLISPRGPKLLSQGNGVTRVLPHAPDLRRRFTNSDVTARLS